MMTRTTVVTILLTCALGTVFAGEDEMLWDNGLIYTHNGGRAISPPVFPDIRVADDIVVRDAGWVITTLTVTTLEDAGWDDGGDITVFIYEDTEGNGPGPIREQVTVPFRTIATGDIYFGREEFHYWIDNLSITLPAGKYWTGIRNGNGRGAGTNYWEGSNAGKDAPGSDTGWFSVDGGATWRPEGSTWHHAFQIRGLRGLPIGADRFEIVRGQHVGGGLLSVQTSDDDYLIVEARRPSAVSQPSVQVIFEGTSSVDLPAELELRLEASVTLGGPIQWIDLYNFETDRWERLDVRDASTDDSLTRVIVSDKPERFMRDDGATRARIAFYDPGIPVVGWWARIDLLDWRVR